ncbi:hypothetical protein Tco_1430839 [Tanacetum coccineum]
MRTSKYSKSNASALDDPTLQAGNPVKEIILKLNPPDHKYNIIYCISDGITTSFQLSQDSPPHAQSTKINT